jgi:hypothetical protein
LVRPGHRKINQPLQTEAAGQSSVDRGFNDGRRKEGKRQRHPDGPLGLALPQRDRLDRLARIGEQFVEPAMSFAEGVGEDNAGP